MAPQAAATSQRGAASASNSAGQSTANTANANTAQANTPQSSIANAQSSTALVSTAGPASPSNVASSTANVASSTANSPIPNASSNAQSQSSALTASPTVPGSSSQQSWAPPSTVVATTYQAITPQAPNTSKALSSGAIGGIVGGIVGAIALAVIAFVLWRTCRGRGEKLPPPPPRAEQHMKHSTHGHSAFGGGHSRHSSMAGHRASSYSTLITPTRGYTYQNPQYYSSYPVDSTSSSLAPENSPRFGPGSTPSGSPSLSSSGTGANTPAAGPSLAPRDYRDGTSSTSDSAEDRELNTQGSHSQLSNAASDLARPVTPSERSAAQGFGSGTDSRTTSPRASTVHLPSVRSFSNLSHGGGRRSSVPRSPSGGAPHTRSMVITLPRPLSGNALAQIPDAVSEHPAQPSQLVYSPRTSTYASFNSARSSHQSTRSHSEFGGPLNSAPRSPTNAHQRGMSSSFPPPDDGLVQTPVDMYGESAADSPPGSGRLPHAIV